MIAYIKGITQGYGDDSIVVDTLGMGYRVYTTKSTIAAARINTDILLYTFMKISDDQMVLYGFSNEPELEMFHLLIQAPGVGPKAALSLLDSSSPDRITNAILSGDISALTKAAGIGKKTAEMICVRLRDKLGGRNIYQTFNDTDQPAANKNDAVQALTALGYTKSEALKAVLQVALPDMETEEIIKKALKAAK